MAYGEAGHGQESFIHMHYQLVVMRYKTSIPFPGHTCRRDSTNDRFVEQSIQRVPSAAVDLIVEIFNYYYPYSIYCKIQDTSHLTSTNAYFLSFTSCPL